MERKAGEEAQSRSSGASRLRELAQLIIFSQAPSVEQTSSHCLAHPWDPNSRPQLSCRGPLALWGGAERGGFHRAVTRISYSSRQFKEWCG